ncbi:hypothetical protein NP493_1056g01015 [Ridgeia piscesae]|uniref:Uncharacterized protein n=1 Tax=Ridgeia piscesae TaxID=27915 RepID=A0AAD9KHT1_RIDPI|nr:hypothetical protein NP493_1056g01015 [Ridgeia piscesae]
MAETTLALVLGDSHVCWLERFVSSSGIRFETGSSFVGTDCHFKFAGFRGGHVSSVRDDSAVDRLLELQMPSIVVLCLGGNDVYGSQEPVLTVGTDCHFKLAGFRGGHVSSVRDDNAVVRLLELQMPSIIVLCLGGNDVYGSLEPVLTVETWLWSDTVDIIAVKRLMLVVIKLLKGYKDQCVTAEA